MYDEKKVEVLIQCIYAEVLKLASELTNREINPAITAACLVQVGMSLYKTTLQEEDYDAMVDSMSKLRNSIPRFGQAEEDEIHNMVIH